MAMTDGDRAALLSRVREAWIRRADALELRGRKRDGAVMDFLAGVRIGLGGNDTTPTDIDGLIFIAHLQGAKAVERLS